MLAEAKNPDGSLSGLEKDADGNLKIAGTFSSEPPIGGATEAKQDDQIDLLGGGLPAALTAGGGVKAGLVDALPAGTNAIGKLTALPGLDIPAHDYISLSYTGSDLTSVVYKTGGPDGTTVATLTLTYSDGKVATVTRSQA